VRDFPREYFIGPEIEETREGQGNLSRGYVIVGPKINVPF
jgi:hypothetical protein